MKNPLTAQNTCLRTKSRILLFVLITLLIISFLPISALAHGSWDEDDIGEYVNTSELDPTRHKYTFNVYTCLNYTGNSDLKINTSTTLTASDFFKTEFDTSKGQDKVKVPVLTKIRTGFVFDSWNTKPNGKGRSFKPGTEINVLSDTKDIWILEGYDDYWYRVNAGDDVFRLNLYAIWRSVETGDVVDGTGAESTANMILTEDNYTAAIGTVPGYQTTLWEWAKNIYGKTSFNSMTDALLFQSSDSVHSAIFSRIELLHKIAIPIAYALIILYFAMKVLEMATEDRLSLTLFLRTTIWLILSLMLVNNSLSLANKLIEFSNALFSALQDGFVNGTGANVRMLQEWLDKLCEKRQLATLVGYTIELGTMQLAKAAGDLVMWFFVWHRVIEMGIRGAFLPIGIANMFDDFRRSLGFLYMKKFVAACLQGCVLLCCLMLIKAVSVTSGSVWLTIQITFGAIVVMIKSSSISQDVVGT